MPSSCRRGGAERYTRPQAGVAQLAEQLSCKQQVVGSNPTASSSGTPNGVRQALRSNVVGRQHLDEEEELLKMLPWRPGTRL
jgi:hypothetical protein